MWFLRDIVYELCCLYQNRTSHTVSVEPEVTRRAHSSAGTTVVYDMSIPF